MLQISVKGNSFRCPKYINSTNNISEQGKRTSQTKQTKPFFDSKFKADFSQVFVTKHLPKSDIR